MSNHFFYTREKVVKKVDDKGTAIMKKDENGVDTKEFETETKIFVDSFNINKVIRTHMLSEDHVVVLLDDGHEESQVVGQRKKNPNKGSTPDNMEEVKQRVWIQSEISVKGEEVQALHERLKNA